MPPDSPQPDDHAMLIAWLSTHDAPCPACKYNLRNLTVPRCPECGRSLSLSIAAVKPYPRTWLAVVILLWSNAFPSLYFWAQFAHDLFQQHHIFFPDGFWPRFLTIFYLSATPLAVASLFLRRPFARLPKPIQILIILPLAAITLVGSSLLIYELL